MTKRMLGATGAAVAGLALTPAVALADETSCRGALGAVTVDDLRVPSGATCTLDGTTVKGQVVVERDATLRSSGARVTGNLQGEGATRVVVSGGSVGGSVQVKQGGGAEVADVRVTGDVQLDANSGAAQRVATNAVGGSIQVVGNGGGVAVERNVVDGNLQCKENSPAPAGGGNVVQGSAEDQCAGLAGGDRSQAGPGSDSGSPTPSASLVRSRLVARRGARTLSLPVRCADDDRCAGTLVLSRAGERLGVTRYAVAAGRTATLRVVLTRAGRSALRGRGAYRAVISGDGRRQGVVLTRR